MDILQSIILGLTQGITEFIPVSSSGHLELVQSLLGGRDADFHTFLSFINLGTLLALIIYFRHHIIKICQDVFQHKNYKLALNIIITCIPAGLAGLLLSHVIHTNDFFSALGTIAVMMGLVGIAMIFVDKLPHLSKLKDENHLTKPRALTIGLAQILALIPGTSRSGTTIIAGRMMGLNNKSAAEYSFLVSIPLMSAVILKTFLDGDDRAYLFTNFGSLILSNLVAFIAGLAAISFIMKYLTKPKSLQTFGYYRVILATIVLVFVLTM